MLDLVDPAFHPKPGSRETDPQTQLPHLLLLRFREICGGLEVWMAGPEYAQCLECSGVDGR